MDDYIYLMSEILRDPEIVIMSDIEKEKENEETTILQGGDG